VIRRTEAPTGPAAHFRLSHRQATASQKPPVAQPVACRLSNGPARSPANKPNPVRSPQNHEPHRAAPERRTAQRRRVVKLRQEERWAANTAVSPAGRAESTNQDGADNTSESQEHLSQRTRRAQRRDAVNHGGGKTLRPKPSSQTRHLHCDPAPYRGPSHNPASRCFLLPVAQARAIKTRLEMPLKSAEQPSLVGAPTRRHPHWTTAEK